MTTHVPKSSTRSPLSSHDALVVARASAAIAELTALDDHWSRAAIAASKGDSGANDSGLGAVVDRLDGLLEQTRTTFAEIADVFSRNAGALNATFKSVIEGKSTGQLALPEPGRRKLQALIDQHGKGDFAVAVTEAARRLASPQRVAAERQAMRGEYDKIRSGAYTDGDFSREEWFDIGLVAAGASAAFGPEAGAIVLGIAGLIDLLL